MAIANPVRPSDVPTNPQIGRRAGRFVAALSVACVLGHIPMLVGHFEHHPKVTLAMAVVAALCVPCVGKLWRAPCRQDVLVAGCLATVMLGIHLCLMLAMAGSSAPAGGGGEHHHGSSAMELAEMSHAPAHGVQFDGFFYVPTALAAAQILLCIGIALRARRC